MKIYLTFILTLVTVASSMNSFGQKSLPDTTFLLRKINKGTYHAIFIDSSKTSRFYDQISNFRFGHFDQETYEYSLKFLRDRNINLPKTPIDDLPKKWIVLKYYKGQYFTYKPSDLYFHYQAEITDSTFTDFTGEGPIANKILNYSKIDNNTFLFLLTGVHSQNRSLTIHLVNSQHGIAVFEERLKDNLSIYYLMIDANKIRQLPVIVNYCETQKQLEFVFDNPDYKMLIGLK